MFFPYPCSSPARAEPGSCIFVAAAHPWAADCHLCLPRDLPPDRTTNTESLKPVGKGSWLRGIAPALYAEDLKSKLQHPSKKESGAVDVIWAPGGSCDLFESQEKMHLLKDIHKSMAKRHLRSVHGDCS